MDGFAIIPDDSSHPAAFFLDLEDALEWALAALGQNRFTIRSWALIPADTAEPDSARRGS